MRKTKIIVTAGPASQSPEAISGLVRAGANAFRLNLSHGTLEEHGRVVSTIREVSERLDTPIGVLVDLQGPRIRTGSIKNGRVDLKEGERVALIPEGEEYGEKAITVTSGDLYAYVKPGDRVLIDEGLVELSVDSVSGRAVLCETKTGGAVTPRRGMNLPGVRINTPALTGEDIRGVDFAIDAGADYIALSFVKTASDIALLKNLLKEKGSEVPVIAKVERAEAVENLAEILRESDGVMIARGDLGTELSPEKVPLLQKKIISMANDAGKVVITATQMLTSMIKDPRPTRAETSDVANAVLDGSDCLMLSGETAVGKYPLKAVEIMARVINEAEGELLQRERFQRRREPGASFTRAICHAAYTASVEQSPKAVVVFTQSGHTAVTMSKLRPPSPIVAFTPVKKTERALTIVWGIAPRCMELGATTDEMICRGEAALLDRGLADFGDTVVIVSGSKVGMRGATNMMKIDWIGSAECRPYLKKKENQP